MTFSSGRNAFFLFRSGQKSLALAILVSAALHAFLEPRAYAQTAKAEISVQTSVFILQPHGFEPAEVTVQAGLTAIYVYNRVGLPELALRLDQEFKDGPPQNPSRFLALRQERVAREHLKWRDVFNLPAGDYRIVEENHPEWVCVIKVLPAK